MTFDEKIISYGTNNAELTTLKKVCDTEKADIKSEMAKMGINSYSAGGYKVSYSVSQRESIDENKMLAVLKRDWVNRYGSIDCPYIKTREYVDMDILESVMYANELPKSVMLELDSCIDRTEVVTLKCTKDKHYKQED